jgi:DNA-binding HxlR family transcriptional regulator
MLSARATTGTHEAPVPFVRLPTADCELVERAGVGLEALQGKWKLHLIVVMARGIRRHSRLLECLPGVSKKVMTDCLRTLERDGFVRREIFAEVPVRVEYTLTPLGWSATEMILVLSDWGESHAEDMSRARHIYWGHDPAPAAAPCLTYPITSSREEPQVAI